MDKNILFVSKAPSNPKEHDIWAKKMLRVQLAMFIADKATCEYCGHTYKSVDDFIRCNPRHGLGKKSITIFVCSSCWNEYKKSHKEE